MEVTRPALSQMSMSCMMSCIANCSCEREGWAVSAGRQEQSPRHVRQRASRHASDTPLVNRATWRRSSFALTMKVHRPQPGIWLQKGTKIKICDNDGNKQSFEMRETRITKPRAMGQPVRAQLPLFFFLDFKRQAEHGIKHLKHRHQGTCARTRTTLQARERTRAPSRRLYQSPSSAARPLQQLRQRIAAAGFPAPHPT